MLNCKLSDFKERCFYSAETDNHLLPDAYIHYHGLNSPLLHVDGTDEGSSIGVFHASAVSLWSVCGNFHSLQVRTRVLLNRIDNTDALSNKINQ